MIRAQLRRAAVVAVLLAAVRPWAFADGPATIPADQIMPTVESELGELRERIRTEVKDPQAQRKALATVAATEAAFKSRVGKIADRTNYMIEAQYVSEAFERLVIKPTNDAIVAMKTSGGDFKMMSAKVDQIVQNAAQREDGFQSAFYAAHQAEIDAVVKARMEERERSDGGYRGGAGNWQGRNRPAMPEEANLPPGMKRFEAFSPLIRIGRASIWEATNPGGAKPGGDGPNGNPPGWSDISNGSVKNGTPEAIGNGAADALAKGDYASAVSLARAALELNPGDKNALGVLYTAQGRDDGAAAAAAGAAGAGKNAAALGTMNGSAGDFAAGGGFPAGGPSSQVASLAAAGAARVAAEQALGGARSALKLGDAQAAIDILSKALGQDPNNPLLLNLRAQAYGRAGRWEDALKDATAGLAAAPGNAPLLMMKALSENRTRRYKDALASAEQLIAADPRNAWAYANRAHAWAGLGDRASMISDINRAAALDPRFQKAAQAASELQLPLQNDVLFLFPGESAAGDAAAAPAAAPGRGRSFGVMVAAGVVGGLLLALGLMSTVLAPLKDTVVSAFTRVKRTGPATQGAVATAQPASAAGNVGGLIRGQYEIARQIGAGGMGMVYEGTDRSLGRRVAIKKMREELRLNARERDRFIIEAKTVASLHHPNIVDIYAIAEEGEDVYLVFEYVDGKTVHDLVQTAGRLEIAEAVRITRAMGEALTYAHSKGVIHRDMKPSNVMLSGGGAVKVMDFGIARMAKDAMTRYSMTNTVVGTPPYMAPEQEQGVVRKESDVYALAICAYEMLTGKLPFIGMGAGMLMNKINMSYIPPSRNIAGLPEALDEVFLKAFQADPEQRYRTPLEFVAALEGAAGGARAQAS